MKVKSLLWSALCMLALSVMFSSCGDDDKNPWDDNGSTVELPQHRAFILYEGVSKGNNAGIAFYAPNKDAKDKKNNFISNIYLKQNNKNLGDTGQDIMEYEDKIYVLLSGSQIMLRLNAAGVEEARLSFTEEDGAPRYMEAEDGKIYVTLYSGRVARINANTLKIEAYVGVNNNPEQIVEANGKLYVANSGWGPGTTVSVIDIATFTKDKDIEVIQNPNLLLESNDEIYLISFGTFGDPVPYAFQRIKSDGTVENIAVATHFVEHNDIIYLANSVTDWKAETTTNSFFSYNTKTHQLNNATFLKNMPQELNSVIVRGINIDDQNGDIYIYAYSGVTNGDVYRFNSSGSLIEKFDCGGIFPSKIIFL
ncbi:hypothetical protein [Bacteroides sp. UBA939]|uniref:hypothetical protein n=1 Tax=Bacteroides sp. UBA939 TaxID=1946092 RepID=UPI0025C2E349|nr:hypothetical protein [Bacteroides sp. UBA939]